VRVLQVASRIEEAGRFHFHLDEAELSVVEDDDLYRKADLRKGDEVTHHHRKRARFRLAPSRYASR
jgi:hypothetical protein